ncbi:hypothetical protein [Alicyclobacillus dauci]|uniref:Uncharacterized protein n=1 Tax=Alicyclobacillus dauci TaxID=1475485 RepID=A0ABY6Z717_9BACL|nr:hypothetical protein [Alicyclobacillus dauci]WAH38682.1 hypothetical protein NZD86_09460 [Alicyclobacillus dauci]
MLYIGGIIGIILVAFAGSALLYGNVLVDRFSEHEEESMNGQTSVSRKGSTRYVVVSSDVEPKGVHTDAV